MRSFPFDPSVLALAFSSFASPIQQANLQQLQLAAIESGPQSRYLHKLHKLHKLPEVSWPMPNKLDKYRQMGQMSQLGLSRRFNLDTLIKPSFSSLN